MEFEFIKEKVNLEPTRKGTYAPIINDWIGTDSKTLKFKCKNEKEYMAAYQGAINYRNAHRCDYTVITRKKLCEVYLVKA